MIEETRKDLNWYLFVVLYHFSEKDYKFGKYNIITVFEENLSGKTKYVLCHLYHTKKYHDERRNIEFCCCCITIIIHNNAR